MFSKKESDFEKLERLFWEFVNNYGEEGFLQFVSPYMTSAPAHSVLMGDLARLFGNDILDAAGPPAGPHQLGLETVAHLDGYPQGEVPVRAELRGERRAGRRAP